MNHAFMYEGTLYFFFYCFWWHYKYFKNLRIFHWYFLLNL